MSEPCRESVELSTLIAYWTGELGDSEVAFEEHLFACPSCTERLRGLAELGAGVVELSRGGKVFASVPGEHLERAEAGGLRIREYRLAPGGSVACTIAPEDDANAIRLAADLTGVERVDLDVYLLGSDGEQHTEHLEDLAFEAAAGEVVLLYPGDAIRPLPRCTFRLELTTGRTSGRRRLGEYTLNHAPWGDAG